jgi:sulfhydrogenase subunit delta
MDDNGQLLPCLSVHSLTGCAGELLVILENMAKILPFARVVSFPFAQSKNDDGPVDIAFVEGTVSQPHDLEKLEKIRRNARWLVAVGNCAVWGCVQGSTCRRWTPEQLVRDVYGEDSTIEALPAYPLDKHVKVDVKLSGCPINESQFLAVTASLLKDHLPYVTSKPVCLECKLKENACVLIENNLPCLGPITAAGCGALCPTFGAACYGCWGPCEDPQMDAMATILNEKGHDMEDVLCRLTGHGIPEAIFSRQQEQDLLKAASK